MTMEEAIRKYREPARDLSCSEATFAAAGEAYGFEVDADALASMAGFSGGLMTEDTCGAVCASVAVLGRLFAEGRAHASPRLKEIVKAYLASVDAEFGTRSCALLKKTRRDLEKDSCDPVIFANARLLAETIDKEKAR